ncbi:MAG: hypothetical protein Q4F49_03000 [Pseudoxanthomonas suwonensis]|nr:hypothetical protein [Pseudoxanthomonas suwonensis]
MAIEATLIKPVVDALMALLRMGGDVQLKRDAQAAVREAIRELLLANPDENKAAARIAIAKAAGILSEDVVLAEDMLARHRRTKARTRGKAATGRKRRSAAQTTDPSSSASTVPTARQATARKTPGRSTAAVAKVAKSGDPATRKAATRKTATRKRAAAAKTRAPTSKKSRNTTARKPGRVRDDTQ